MSLVDVDSWLTEYEACERLNHWLLAQLTQREKRQPLSTEYNRLTASIQVALKQFDTEVQQLKEKLKVSDVSNSITPEEIERRHQQVNKLSSQLLQLQRKFNNTTRSDRITLLNQPPATSASTSSSSQWQSQAGNGRNGASAAPVIDTTDVDTLKRRQIEILEQQNRGLDVLSQTISRQRELASQIGQEVEDQNDILDNLANTMESVDARVSVETGNISLVNRQDSTFCYWLIISLLFLAIVLVMALL